MTGNASAQNRQVFVCQHHSCLQRGSTAVLEQFQTLSPDSISIHSSSCMGQCSSGVTVRVLPDNLWYCKVQPSHVGQITTEHLQGDRPVKALLHPRFHPPAFPGINSCATFQET